MQTAKVIFILLIIFMVVWLFAYLGLSHAIMDIKDSLEIIKYVCNNNGEISHSEYVLKELISKSHKELLTEIACLATKNNEDIKRMGGKFEEWDLVELEGKEMLIYSAKPNANGQMVFNCIDKDGKTYSYFGLDKLNRVNFLDGKTYSYFGLDKLNQVNFLRHVTPPFGE